MKTYFKRNRVLVVHLLFWCMYFSFFFYQISFGRGNREAPNYSRAFIDAIFQVITLAGISYFNYFVLIPRFSQHRKAFRYALEFLLPFVLVILLQLTIKREIYRDVISENEVFFFRTRFIISHSIIVLFVVAFVAMLRFASEWFDLQAKKQEVANDKLATELRFLKEQINPHFLFNTLNNIYYLAHSQSPKTKDVVAKLSQMMRYMIYDSNQDNVLLIKEIEYIENYITLEKMRLEDDFPIHFEVKGATQGLRIAPFVFITFLENAFKHGTNNELSNKGIDIRLNFVGNSCTYEVKNGKSANKSTSENEGIGLKNIERRLNLIYPEKHKLNIQETNDTFTATLVLEL